MTGIVKTLTSPAIGILEAVKSTKLTQISIDVAFRAFSLETIERHRLSLNGHALG